MFIFRVKAIAVPTDAAAGTFRYCQLPTEVTAAGPSPAGTAGGDSGVRLPFAFILNCETE